MFYKTAAGMDAKVTLQFDAQTIEEARQFALNHGISLSRLTEILLRKATAQGNKNIEDIRVADWVTAISEGEATYVKPRKRKDMKQEFYNRK